MNEGHAQLERLHLELRKSLKKPVADDLFSFFRWRPIMGSFGANEVEARVTHSLDAEGRQVKLVEIHKRNPFTGETIFDYTCLHSELLEREGLDPSLFVE